VTLAVGLGLLVMAFAPSVARVSRGYAAYHRSAALVAALEAHAHPAPILDDALSVRVSRLGPLLASWETVGGCGAGASTGTGAGVKWIGRNVTGGLFHVELQSNYVQTSYGYNYVATALVSRDVNAKWNFGVGVPYLYKYMRNPYDDGNDIANGGPGDVSLLVTRRLGAINDWSTTLSLGLPTGTHDAQYGPVVLPQDRQLGFGKPTASLIVDHTIDHDWGPTVLGGTANWRGGRNDQQSYRAPSANVYGYAGYLVGPFVPALGLSVNGAAGHDENALVRQTTPLLSVAANASIEWSTDTVAVLVGGTLPYGFTNAVGGAASGWSFGPWIIALGVAFAPF
jgi:hypothetical protein